jgi:hypothetical protein
MSDWLRRVIPRPIHMFWHRNVCARLERWRHDGEGASPTEIG